MKNLTVGIFHDQELGRELGKKSSETDILMFSRKTESCVYTFLSPLEDRLIPKSQIMSSIDAAIVNLGAIGPEAGETIIMLDSFGITKGLFLAPADADMGRIKAMVKGTSLESFALRERNAQAIFDVLDGLEAEKDAGSPVVVAIDQSFSVKGVGEVALGFVQQGMLKKFDQLELLPPGKEVTVRSIQMQDKDFDEAPAGSMVGVAVKGATAEEMKPGSVLCAPSAAKKAMKINLAFEKNSFYPDLRPGAFHVSVGLQTYPVKVDGNGQGQLTIESEKPIVYLPGSIFLLLDLNAKKMHVIGKGKAL
jgi:selenocysteine-specific translation elongation factor